MRDRAYLITDVCFIDRIVDELRSLRNKRNTRPDGFSNYFYTTWSDKLVRLDYVATDRPVITVFDTEWVLDISFKQYDRGVDKIMLTGDIVAFEKWELLQKLSYVPKQSDDGEYIPF